MDSETTVELIASPSSERIRSDLADAPGWSAYVVELRGLLAMAIDKSKIDRLDVGELFIGEATIPERYLHLRNGTGVSPTEAIDLVERMAAGRSPYCRLSSPGRLQIESGWDGAVHVYSTPLLAADLSTLGGEAMSLRLRQALPKDIDASNLVEAVAGSGFWEAVRGVSGKVTLLCERWAHGAYGCRWFRVVAGNVNEIARKVSPRSLLCVVVDPKLRPNPNLLEDHFTAFVEPLLPGELVHSLLPDVQSVQEMLDQGYSLMLPDDAIGNWCVVVPDRDGVNRGVWELLD